MSICYPLSIPKVSDPWINLDGRLNAPSGSAQYPNLLNGYAARPPWRVAGVDYAVGVDQNITLLDGSNAANLPAGCDIGPVWRVNVNVANVTLENLDFLTSGMLIYLWGAASNTTIRNCKAVAVVNPVSGSVSNTLISKCLFDMSGVNDINALILWNESTTNFTMEYVHLKNASSDIVNWTSITDMQFRYCLFDTAGLQIGTHGDYTQILGSVAGSTGWSIRFCTTTQQSAGVGTQGLMCEPNAGATITAGEVAYNTFKSGGGQPSYMLAVTESMVTGGFAVHDNYYDITGISGFSPGAGRGGANDGSAFTSFYNNRDMVTGSLGNNDS
jgi:hypothetical protein